ncbi:MAG TPA: hypothetical protein VJC18_04730, partial [bacterium]|nr:hypothetical protein [bacterium]
SLFENRAYVPPLDLGTFWATFADVYARSTHKRSNLFDNRSPNEIATILKHSILKTLSPAEALLLERSTKTTIGIVIRGCLGHGVVSDFGHHWYNLFREGDTFVIMNGQVDSQTNIVALEDSQVAILSPNFATEIKSDDPVLAARLSMSTLAIIQQFIAEMEEGSVDVENETIAIQL